jgi:putative transposase
MPWKECHVTDERLRFVARLLEGEKMAPLCAEFRISRKTGYKIHYRYKDCRIDALTDRSRRPLRQANRLPPPIEATIVRLKREYPAWAPPKSANDHDCFCRYVYPRISLMIFRRNIRSWHEASPTRV